MNRKRILLVGATVLVLVFGLGLYLTASTWGDVQRVTIDRPMAAGEDEVEADTESVELVDEEGVEITLPPSGDGLDVQLIVGSDSRENLEDTEGFGEFGGQRADVIMVLIRDREAGGQPAILSIPRDLWVEKVCGEGSQRINDALQGCASMNGPTALVQTVENLIGIPIDHFAMVDLAGFQESVDAIGGYEICVENPVRDSRAGLSLPGGCTHADGEQTLAWLRSRHTQELTEAGWKTMAGVSDLARNARQREFLVSMMSRVADFSNPQDIVGIAQSVAPYITVDDDLSLMDAVGLATTLRGIGSDSVVELELQVADHVAENGASVLLAVIDPAQVVADFLAPATAEGGAGDT